MKDILIIFIYIYYFTKGVRNLVQKLREPQKVLICGQANKCEQVDKHRVAFTVPVLH